MGKLGRICQVCKLTKFGATLVVVVVVVVVVATVAVVAGGVVVVGGRGRRWWGRLWTARAIYGLGFLKKSNTAYQIRVRRRWCGQKTWPFTCGRV